MRLGILLCVAALAVSAEHTTNQTQDVALPSPVPRRLKVKFRIATLTNAILVVSNKLNALTGLVKTGLRAGVSIGSETVKLINDAVSFLPEVTKIGLDLDTDNVNKAVCTLHELNACLSFQSIVQEDAKTPNLMKYILETQVPGKAMNSSEIGGNFWMRANFGQPYTAFSNLVSELNEYDKTGKNKWGGFTTPESSYADRVGPKIWDQAAAETYVNSLFLGEEKSEDWEKIFKNPRYSGGYICDSQTQRTFERIMYEYKNAGLHFSDVNFAPPPLCSYKQKGYESIYKDNDVCEVPQSIPNPNFHLWEASPPTDLDVSQVGSDYILPDVPIVSASVTCTSPKYMQITECQVVGSGSCPITPSAAIIRGNVGDVLLAFTSPDATGGVVGGVFTVAATHEGGGVSQVTYTGVGTAATVKSFRLEGIAVPARVFTSGYASVPNGFTVKAETEFAVYAEADATTGYADKLDTWTVVTIGGSLKFSSDMTQPVTEDSRLVVTKFTAPLTLTCIDGPKRNVNGCLWTGGT